MSLTKLTMRRPVSVFIIVLALIAFGIQAMMGAPLELIPEMNMPMLMVMSNYPGAGPEEVDELVTTVLESAVASMPGVEDVYAFSQEGFSGIQMMFAYGTDMDKTYMELSKKLDLYAQGLPEKASKPTIMELALDSGSTISVAAKATGDVDLYNYINETIRSEFEKIGGVASVEVSGGQKDYISIRLREEDLKQYGLDMASVANTIASANFSMPAGTVDRGSSQLTLRGGVTYDSTESLRSMPLMLRTGAIIQLSDVADIYESKMDTGAISRYNGEETVTLDVKKRQSASTIDVCQDTVRTVEYLNSQQIGVELSVVSDTSEQILSAINTVVKTLLLGIILSMVVLFIFFGEWRASLIVACSMPISVLATIIIMYQIGFSFNIISLGGLVIGVGMMVDNAIVVVESCFRTVQQKLEPKEAAIKGTQLVTSSIIASTITTVVVFLPISIMEGMTGQLFKQLGYTIIFSLTMSLLSALTMVPLMFMRARPRERENFITTRVLNWIGDRYGRFLQKTFKVKWLVVLTSILLLVGSVMLLPIINTELIPSIDQGMIIISTSNRPGLNLEKVDEISRSLEAVVAADTDVDNYSLNASGNGATLYVYLKKDRVRDTNEIVDDWRAQTGDTVDYTVKVTAYNMADAMSGGGGVQINLQSSDRNQLKLASKQVIDMMEATPGIIRATSDITDGNPQAEIVIDPIKASASGLMPIQVIQAVSGAMDGKSAATLNQNGRSYDLRVEYPDDTYSAVTDLEGFTILNSAGRLVPLMDVASIKYSNAPQSLNKMNNQYMVSITAEPTSEAKTTANATIMGQMANMPLPTGVTFQGGFTNQAMIDEFTSMASAILSAVFLVFMVMAMQFESVKFSLVVMMCIPFSLIGCFGLLALTGVTLSMPSLMGLLMLVGIVINNGILFIDTTNQLRDSMDAETALIYAGKSRLRPILMTTLTTVLSMVPMALGIGEGSEIMQGMAVVIIGGLCASTLLTLLLLPSFYLLMNKKRKEKKRGKKGKEQNKELTTSDSPQDAGFYDNEFIDDLPEGFPQEEQTKLPNPQTP